MRKNLTRNRSLNYNERKAKTEISRVPLMQQSPQSPHGSHNPQGPHITQQQVKKSLVTTEADGKIGLAKFMERKAERKGQLLAERKGNLSMKSSVQPSAQSLTDRSAQPSTQPSVRPLTEPSTTSLTERSARSLTDPSAQPSSVTLPGNSALSIRKILNRNTEPSPTISSNMNDMLIKKSIAHASNNITEVTTLINNSTVDSEGGDVSSAYIKVGSDGDEKDGTGVVAKMEDGEGVIYLNGTKLVAKNGGNTFTVGGNVSTIDWTQTKLKDSGPIAIGDAEILTSASMSSYVTEEKLNTKLADYDDKVTVDEKIANVEDTGGAVTINAKVSTLNWDSEVLTGATDNDTPNTVKIGTGNEGYLKVGVNGAVTGTGKGVVFRTKASDGTGEAFLNGTAIDPARYYSKSEVYTKDEVDAILSSGSIPEEGGGGGEGGTPPPSDLRIRVKVSKLVWDNGNELRDTAPVTINGDIILLQNTMNDTYYNISEVDAKLNGLSGDGNFILNTNVSDLNWDIKTSGEVFQIRNVNEPLAIGNDNIVTENVIANYTKTNELNDTVNAKVSLLEYDDGDNIKSSKPMTINSQEVKTENEVTAKLSAYATNEELKAYKSKVSALNWDLGTDDSALRTDGIVIIGDDASASLSVGKNGADVTPDVTGIVKIGVNASSEASNSIGGMLNVGIGMSASTGSQTIANQGTGTVNIGVSETGNATGIMNVGISSTIENANGGVLIGKRVVKGTEDNIHIESLGGNAAFALGHGDESTRGVVLKYAKGSDTGIIKLNGADVSAEAVDVKVGNEDIEWVSDKLSGFEGKNVMVKNSTENGATSLYIGRDENTDANDTSGISFVKQSTGTSEMKIGYASLTDNGGVVGINSSVGQTGGADTNEPFIVKGKKEKILSNETMTSAKFGAAVCDNRILIGGAKGGYVDYDFENGVDETLTLCDNLNETAAITRLDNGFSVVIKQSGGEDTYCLVYHAYLSPASTESFYFNNSPITTGVGNITGCLMVDYRHMIVYGEGSSGNFMKMIELTLDNFAFANGDLFIAMEKSTTFNPGVGSIRCAALIDSTHVLVCGDGGKFAQVVTIDLASEISIFYVYSRISGNNPNPGIGRVNCCALLDESHVFIGGNGNDAGDSYAQVLYINKGDYYRLSVVDANMKINPSIGSINACSIIDDETILLGGNGGNESYISMIYYDVRKKTNPLSLATKKLTLSPNVGSVIYCHAIDKNNIYILGSNGTSRFAVINYANSSGLEVGDKVDVPVKVLEGWYKLLIVPVFYQVFDSENTFMCKGILDTDCNMITDFSEYMDLQLYEVFTHEKIDERHFYRCCTYGSSFIHEICRVELDGTILNVTNAESMKTLFNNTYSHSAVSIDPTHMFISTSDGKGYFYEVNVNEGMMQRINNTILATEFNGYSNLDCCVTKIPNYVIISGYNNDNVQFGMFKIDTSNNYNLSKVGTMVTYPKDENYPIHYVFVINEKYIYAAYHNNHDNNVIYSYNINGEFRKVSSLKDTWPTQTCIPLNHSMFALFNGSIYSIDESGTTTEIGAGSSPHNELLCALYDDYILVGEMLTGIHCLYSVKFSTDDLLFKHSYAYPCRVRLEWSRKEYNALLFDVYNPIVKTSKGPAFSVTHNKSLQRNDIIANIPTSISLNKANSSLYIGKSKEFPTTSVINQNLCLCGSNGTNACLVTCTKSKDSFTYTKTGSLDITQMETIKGMMQLDDTHIVVYGGKDSTAETAQTPAIGKLAMVEMTLTPPFVSKVLSTLDITDADYVYGSEKLDDKHFVIASGGDFLHPSESTTCKAMYRVIEVGTDYSMTIKTTQGFESGNQYISGLTMLNDNVVSGCSAFRNNVFNYSSSTNYKIDDSYAFTQSGGISNAWGQFMLIVKFMKTSNIAFVLHNGIAATESLPTACSYDPNTHVITLYISGVDTPEGENGYIFSASDTFDIGNSRIGLVGNRSLAIVPVFSDGSFDEINAKQIDNIPHNVTSCVKYNNNHIIVTGEGRVSVVNIGTDFTPSLVSAAPSSINGITSISKVLVIPTYDTTPAIPFVASTDSSNTATVTINGKEIYKSLTDTSTKLSSIESTIQKSRTVTHEAPFTSNVSEYHIGMPVFITGNVKSFDFGTNTWTSSTSSVNCISEVKPSGTDSEFIGILVGYTAKDGRVIYNDNEAHETTPRSIVFASHGDYYVHVNDTSKYHAGDLVTYNGTIISPDTSLTNKLTKIIIGTVTGIIDANTIAVFRS